MKRKNVLSVFFSVIFLSLSVCSFAQNDYEIEVYPAQTIEKGFTSVELHGNYAFDEKKDSLNGVPTSMQPVHATIEITHGFTDCFEMGFYLFNNIGSSGSFNYVGSHLRPRISAPQSWNLPIGLSLSAEVGYQKPEFSEDDWSLELRPIIDKKFHKLYLAFNPTLDKSLHGLNKNLGFVFAPDAKISYELSEIFTPGIEYYSSVGSLTHFDPIQKQIHQLFISLDVEFSPKWELNLGYGIGFTDATDYSIVKFILGRKFK